MPKKKINLTSHILVPKHLKLNDKEKKDFLDKYNISIEQMPSINKKDPAINDLNAKVGDIIRIDRKSATTGEYTFYRTVIN